MLTKLTFDSTPLITRYYTRQNQPLETLNTLGRNLFVVDSRNAKEFLPYTELNVQDKPVTYMYLKDEESDKAEYGVAIKNMRLKPRNKAMLYVAMNLHKEALDPASFEVHNKDYIQFVTLFITSTLKSNLYLDPFSTYVYSINISYALMRMLGDTGDIITRLLKMFPDLDEAFIRDVTSDKVVCYGTMLAHIATVEGVANAVKTDVDTFIALMSSTVPTFARTVLAGALSHPASMMALIEYLKDNKFIRCKMVDFIKKNGKSKLVIGNKLGEELLS